MTSFAKVCVDISNNLKNLRLTGKSSSNEKVGGQDTRSSTNSVCTPNGSHENGDMGPKSSADGTLCYSSRSSNQNTPWSNSSQANNSYPTSSNSKNQYVYSNTKASNQRTKSANSSPCLNQRKYPHTDVRFERKAMNFHNNGKCSTSECTHIHDSANSLPNIVPQPFVMPFTPTMPKRQFGNSPYTYEVSPRTGRAFQGNSSSADSTNYVNSSSGKSYLPPFSPTLSHRVMALAQRVQADSFPKYRSYSNSACNSPNLSQRGVTVAAIKQRLFNQGLKIDIGGSPPLKPSTRYKDYIRRNFFTRQLGMKQLFQQEKLLRLLFKYLDGKDLLSCNLVCNNWFKILSKLRYFDRVYLKLDFKKEFSSNTSVHSDEYIEKRVKDIILAGIKRNLRCIKLDHLTDAFVLNMIKSLKQCHEVVGEVMRPIPKPHSKSTANTMRKPVSSPAESSSTAMEPVNVQKSQISASSSSSSTNSANSNTSGSSIELDSSCSSSGIGSSLGSNHCKYESSTSTRSSTSTSNTIIPEDSPVVNNSKAQKHSDTDSPDIAYGYFEQLAIHNCTISDKSLESITRYLATLKSLDVRCCNDLTELCLWSSLQPSLVRLTILDCINISDESFGAICQLLPNLMELNLQAYHVTDTAMSYFTAQHRQCLQTIRLTQCMDLTNQGVINMAHGLPNLQRLSLSGSSKLSDDGLDVVCENMKQLGYLDLSWCSKITNSGLECVACDLYLLNTLILDHCTLISDFGIRHLSTMPSLKNLTLRWCELLTDAALIHILNIPKLNYLSISGCKRITCDGICSLVRHPKLQIIELTHCTAATASVKAYLKQNISNCIILD